MKAGARRPVTQRRPIKDDALAGINFSLPIKRQMIAKLPDDDLGMSASVGRPPGTTCSGACACATAPEQRRHAYLGRRVTNTRNWAGITSRRSELADAYWTGSSAAGGFSAGSASGGRAAGMFVGFTFLAEACTEALAMADCLATGVACFWGWDPHDGSKARIGAHMDQRWLPPFNPFRNRWADWGQLPDGRLLISG
jgi:hypothetical protein